MLDWLLLQISEAVSSLVTVRVTVRKTRCLRFVAFCLAQCGVADAAGVLC